MFECFVTIDGKKENICLDKDMDSVVFGDIYRHLLTFNVSFDTHLFEVMFYLFIVVVLPSHTSMMGKSDI